MDRIPVTVILKALRFHHSFYRKRYHRLFEAHPENVV